MKEIELTRGFVAVIDDEDFERVNGIAWQVSAPRHGKNGHVYYYAQGHIGPRATRKAVLMHRFILDAPAGVQVDHADGDGLHNWKTNLRLCDASQNAANSGGRGRTSKYTPFKGVSFLKKGGSKPWMARIGDGSGRYSYIGVFATAEEAARAYDDVARSWFKEYARLNFPRSGERALDGTVREARCE